MASPSLVVRSGVGAWTSVKYLITRGLDIGAAASVDPGTGRPVIPPELGSPVSTSEISLYAMVANAWGSEFAAPDHRVYVFGDGARSFDSADRGESGFYRR